MLREFCEWIVTASATNATATATKTAVTGKTHFVSHITASFGAAATGVVVVTLLDGATTLATWNFSFSATYGMPLWVAFDRPIKITPGNAVSVTLGAGGAAVVGTVNLAGFTIN